MYNVVYTCSSTVGLIFMNVKTSIYMYISDVCYLMLGCLVLRKALTRDDSFLIIVLNFELAVM